MGLLDQITRIPLTDPLHARAGTLCVSLPRECFAGQCAPDPLFYGRDEVSLDAGCTSVASSSLSVSVSRDEKTSLSTVVPVSSRIATDPHAQALDAVVQGVGNVRDILADASNHLFSGAFSLQRVGSDFQQAGWPLADIGRETPENDVSGSGMQLGFILMGAHTDASDARQHVQSAAQGSGEGAVALDGTRQQLGALVSSLKADPAKYGTVLCSLDAAAHLLDTAAQGGAALSHDFPGALADLQGMQNQIVDTRDPVAQITTDAPGGNVSSAAQRVASSLSGASSGLNNVLSDVSLAQNDLGPVDANLARAQTVLQQASDALGRLR